MDFAYIIILSFVSLAVLFIITKIMGFRQISEMSFFDYVIGITIGSIAAEMATNIDLEWWKGILAMVVYGVVGVLISVLAQKRQLNPKDFNFAPEREGLYINVIMDGHIIDDNLSVAGVTKRELDNMLKAKGDKLENIFLGTIDINKQLTTYLK